MSLLPPPPPPPVMMSLPLTSVPLSLFFSRCLRAFLLLSVCQSFSLSLSSSRGWVCLCSHIRTAPSHCGENKRGREVNMWGNSFFLLFFLLVSYSSSDLNSLFSVTFLNVFFFLIFVKAEICILFELKNRWSLDIKGWTSLQCFSVS